MSHNDSVVNRPPLPTSGDDNRSDRHAEEDTLGDKKHLMAFASPTTEGSFPSLEDIAEPEGEKPWDSNWGLVVAFCVLVIQYGIFGSMTSYPIFTESMSKDEQLGNPTATELALPLAISNGLSPVLSAFVGDLCDHLGPRPVLATASLLTSVGLVAASFAPSTICLIVFYAAPVCIGAAAAAAPAMASVASWLRRRLPLGMGIACGGNGAASITLIPLCGAMASSSLGWRNSFRILAIAPLLSFVASLFVTHRVKAPKRPLLSRRDLVFIKQLWSTPVYWLLFLVGACISFTMFAILYFTVPFATSFGRAGTPYENYERIDPTVASSLFTWYGVANWISSPLLGWLANHTEPRLVGALCCGLMATSTIFWALCETYFQLAAVAVVNGIAIAGGFAVVPAMAGHCFCGPRCGMATGLVLASYGVGGLGAPVILSAVKAALDGDMTVSFGIAALASALGGVVSLVFLRGRVRHQPFANFDVTREGDDPLWARDV